ncbi:MAG TPA: GAF domain-containing protein [Trueperaceae bacterium]|nr:GAF domain-containing protein [Trueperaceae bacterium]
MPLVRNAYAVSLLLTALAVLVLGVAAWLRRRAVRGGAVLAALAAAATAWAVCEALWLMAGGPPAGAVWLQAERAAGALTALGLLAYALRATRMLGQAGRAALWLAAALTAGAVALAFGPPGGLSLWRVLRQGAAAGRVVTVGMPGAWGAAATVLVGVMVAAAVLLLALAWLRAGPGVAAGQGWTLLGVAMPVLAEVVAALLPGEPGAPAGGTGLSPGAFLLAPAALAVAQGLLGGGRGLLPAGAAVPAPSAGAAPKELLDHLDQPVLLVGPGETVSYANAAAGRLFRPTGGLAGARVAALFGDVPELASALAGRRSAVVELELRRKSAVRPFEAWLTPLYQRSGRYAGSMVAFVDVEALRRAEAERDTAVAELRRVEAVVEALREALHGALRDEPTAMLFDMVVTGASRGLDLPHAALYLHDAGSDAMVRRLAVGGFEAMEEPPVRPDEGLVGQVWASGKPQATEGLLHGAEADAPGWAGTAIGVPLRQRGRVVGVLLAARRGGDWRAFGGSEIAALERFADLAAVTARDAAVSRRAERAEGELEWLDRIDALVARDAPDTEVLAAALRAAREAAGFDRVVLWLATEDGSALEAHAWLGFPPGPEGGERWPLNGSVPLLEEVYRSGEEVVLAYGGPLPERYRPSGSAADAPLLRAARPAVLPLGAGACVLGVLAADDRREGAELEARLGALRRVAGRVAQALERGRLRVSAAALRERSEAAEARLDAASARHEALVEALPAAYVETDLSGVVTRASAQLARLTGAADEGLKGMRLADLSAPGSEQTVPALMGRVLRSGRPAHSLDWALRLRDGGVLQVEVSLGVLRDAGGTAAGYFGVVVPRHG